MAKRALLIGCNYPGSEAALNGCINDVMTMNSLLTSRWGFNDSDIIIQIDTDPSFTKPTGKNIRAALTQLVSQTKPGDTLFFHFSGHGTQLPAKGSDYELDGKDEAICPTDMNLIMDDDLRAIFGKLPQGANLTMVSDCCHSGGMLDHESVVISGQKTGGASSGGGGLGGLLLGGAAKALGGTRSFGQKAGGVGAMLAMGTAQLAGLVKADGVMNRSLPVHVISQILSAQTGQKVDANNLVASLATAFGSDASGGLLGKLASGVLKQNASGGGGGGGIPSWLTSAASSMLAGGGGAQSGGAGSGALAGMMGMMGGGAPVAAAPAAPETAAPSLTADGKLHDDVGILVTGCQSNETSADACPSGDPKKAFGALTNAIRTVLLQHNGENITNRQLVAEVRAFLAKGKFTQNPCLECSLTNAEKPFLCPLA